MVRVARQKQSRLVLVITCAILDDDSLKCWGSGYNGILGLGDTEIRGDDANEMGDNLPTVDLGTGRTATSVSVGQLLYMRIIR